MAGRVLCAALLLVGLVLPAVGEDSDIAVGRELVQLYCAACHSIEVDGDSPHEEAPPFRTLHDRYEVEWLSEGLVEGLVSGHPDMPEFEFDPQQAEGIVAYLKSLAD
jgi:cytochrome c